MACTTQTTQKSAAPLSRGKRRINWLRNSAPVTNNFLLSPNQIFMPWVARVSSGGAAEVSPACEGGVHFKSEWSAVRTALLPDASKCPLGRFGNNFVVARRQPFQSPTHTFSHLRVLPQTRVSSRIASISQNP